MKHENHFEIVDGTQSKGDLALYALSTCGFCKRALAFLKGHSIMFKFLYVDDLPIDVKEEIKAELYGKFHQQIRYPFLVINDEQYLVGFTEEEWEHTLGIK